MSGSVSVKTIGGVVSGDAEAGAGATLFIAPGAARTHRFSPDARVISVHFSVESAECRPLFRALPLVVWVPDGTADRLVAAGRRLVAAVKPERGRGLSRHLRARGELYLFAAVLFEALEAKGSAPGAEAAADPRLDAVLADLSQEPRGGPLPYASWTRLTGLGRSQLDRLCRQHCGESLRARRDAVLMARLERALAVGAQDIKALAYDYGFVDASHLTRWFRSQSGTTPAAFRRSLRRAAVEHGAP